MTNTENEIEDLYPVNHFVHETIMSMIKTIAISQLLFISVPGAGFNSNDGDHYLKIIDQENIFWIIGIIVLLVLWLIVSSVHQ